MSLPVQGFVPPFPNWNAAGTTLAKDFIHDRSDGREWMPFLSTSELKNPKRGRRMNPLKVSVLFASYVWFTHRNKGTPTVKKEAVSFARDNWQAFLPCAHKGLGKLLIRIAGGRHRRGRRRRSSSRVSAG
jgi:hypothetical protein